LQFLGLNGFEQRLTFKLSGGEKRLVALATILAMEPEVLLLDEPTTGLDRQTKERLKSVLNQLNASLVVVSHEYDFVSEITHSIHTIRDGKIQLNSESILHRHVHAHPYGTHQHQHD